MISIILFLTLLSIVEIYVLKTLLLPPIKAWVFFKYQFKGLIFNDDDE